MYAQRLDVTLTAAASSTLSTAWPKHYSWSPLDNRSAQLLHAGCIVDVGWLTSLSKLLTAQQSPFTARSPSSSTSGFVGILNGYSSLPRALNFAILVDVFHRHPVNNALLSMRGLHPHGSFATPESMFEPILKDFPRFTKPPDWTKPIHHDVVRSAVAHRPPVHSLAMPHLLPWSSPTRSSSLPPLAHQLLPAAVV